jgi:spermidine synthase
MTSPTRPSGGQPLVTLSLLFFVSGATALSAEVVLNKLLTYVFGSSHLATSTVLAAYMAGLSAGAWLFGRISAWRAPGVARPVVAYAALELSVGALYALLPLVFGPFQKLALALASPLAASPALLTGARFGLSFLLVFAPTLLMGGTLPTLVSAFERGAALERSLPLLYAANTLGAAAGTLIASYAAVPSLGLDGTLYACAGLNVVIAVLALLVARRPAAPEPSEPPAAPRDEGPAFAGGHLPRRAVYALAFAQGVLSFGLEVVWSHLIGTVIGVTAYAFALMLFAILLGIGAGSALVPRLSRGRAPAQLFALSMLLLAAAVTGSLFGWDRFGWVIARFRALAAGGHFWGREAVRLGFCLALLFPPALAMGISLPALAASARAEEHGRWVGRVFASNTLGTITGSLFTGFVLLGRLSSERILSLAVVAALALGLTAVALAEGRARTSAAMRAALGLGALVTLAVALGFRGFDRERLTRGMHYYWYLSADAAAEKVHWLREDAQSGFITVTHTPAGLKTLRTNGKYEGTDAAGEFQDLFALFGGLYVKRWERAAIVGIGPARTLRVMHEMPFAHIEAVEFSPAILEAAYGEFGDFARVPFDDEARVSVHCADGRDHLQLSRQRYDYVAVAITGAAFAGSSNIYSRDFFRAVDARLSPEGVFMLWIQVHHVMPEDVRSVIFTLRDAFPHVHLYTDGAQTQGFLLASRAPLTIDPAGVEAKLGSERLTRTLAAHGLGSPLDLTERAVFTTEAELRRYFDDPYLARKPELMTDLRPTFEYRTPYGLAAEIRAYDFQPFSDKLLPPFDPPLPEAPQRALHARRLIAARDLEGALAELTRAKELGRTTRWDAQIAWVKARMRE